MSANLITGNGFSPITASMDADFQSGIVGDKTVILPIGSNMALSIEDANTIKADDGVIVTKEGRRIQIDNGAIEEWTIPTGSQGQTKYYIVGFHIYTDDEASEICETFVQEVESASIVLPEATIRGGATEVYISLGRIKQVGVNLDSVTELIPVSKSIAEYEEEISQINTNLTELESEVTTLMNSGFKSRLITVSFTNSKTYNLTDFGDDVAVDSSDDYFVIFNSIISTASMDNKTATSFDMHTGSSSGSYKFTVQLIWKPASN